MNFPEADLKYILYMPQGSGSKNGDLKAGPSQPFLMQEAFQNRPVMSLTEVTQSELGRISSLKTPNKVLAVVHIPEWNQILTNWEIHFLLCSIKFRIRETWAPLSGRPTGLGLITLYFLKIRPIIPIPKLYRHQWVLY
jgi:hypothetical protein